MLDILKDLLSILNKKERRKGLIILFFIVISGLLDIVGLATIMPFISIVSNNDIIRENYFLNFFYELFGFNGITGFIIFLGFFILTLIIFSSVLRGFTYFLQVRYCLSKEYSVGSLLTEKYLNQSYEWFLNKNSSEIGRSILSDIEFFTNRGFLPAMEMVANIIVSILLFILLIYVNIQVASTIAFLIISSYLIIYFLVRKYLSKIGLDRYEANKGKFNTINEIFNSIKIIKLSNSENKFINKFRDFSKRYSIQQSSAMTISQVPKYTMEAITFGVIIVLLTTLIILNISIEDSLPLLALYVVTGLRLLPSLQKIYYNYSTILYAKDSIKKICSDMYNLNFDNYISNRKIKIKFEKKIILDSICFKYPNSNNEVLVNCNLQINKNQKIAIVGPSGSGKSTLIDILLFLLKPSKGFIKIDDKLLNEKNKRNWQNIIGYVPQNVYLYNQTLNYNISFGNEFSESKVIKAARLANIDNFIETLPDKYNTIIGGESIRLSGGQIQRIGIARAIYNNPEILILDEATNALDNFTEQNIIKSLSLINKNTTIISIAHRLTTVKNADIIFILENGEIIDSGNYSQLIKNNDLFKLMALHELT